jgi:hypothetical protein
METKMICSGSEKNGCDDDDDDDDNNNNNNMLHFLPSC